MPEPPDSRTLTGLVVPVLTPFDADGCVDEQAFIRHLEYLRQHGVNRILINGTTGEFFSLLPEERRKLARLAREHFAGSIILHAGGAGVRQNRLEVQWAGRYGLDAVAVLPPVYPAGLPEEGIIDYLRALEAAAAVPFVLYNFPRHTGNPLTPRILKAVPHAALKDSGQNLELIEATPKYFIGSSTRILEPVRQGAAGFVSATANVRPALYVAFEAVLAGPRAEEAAIMQEEIRTYSTPFSTGGIPLLKQALSRLLPGYPAHVRPPLQRALCRY